MIEHLLRINPRQVKRDGSQAFGDTSAAFGLEVAILNYVVAVALMLVTKYVLEYVRYLYNILYSFQTLEEFHQVRRDMEESFTQYNLPLKYLITSVEWDPNVLENPKRGPNKIEKTMGLL